MRLSVTQTRSLTGEKITDKLRLGSLLSPTMGRNPRKRCFWHQKGTLLSSRQIHVISFGMFCFVQKKMNYFGRTISDFLPRPTPPWEYIRLAADLYFTPHPIMRLVEKHDVSPLGTLMDALMQ